MSDVRQLLEPIRRLHERMRDAVVEACERSAVEAMSRVSDDDLGGDTIYAIDRVSEETLLELWSREIDVPEPVVLIAEGLADGALTLPEGSRASDARWRVIVDPIDGTRGLMYQKRSAWILTGVAPDRGPGTGLRDIELAVQTEIPLVKQHLSDTLWAVRGEGAEAERLNRITGDRQPITLRPSRAETIAHGFAQISRFFPGAREELAAIDEEIVRGALGPVERGKAHCFEDQYVSTGGQLYELVAGHDRFVADLRPYTERLLAQRGLSPGICCHPYDICTELIARELGIEITDVRGEPLSAPLDLETDVDWVGYANAAIRREIEPLLQKALRDRGALE
jgi:fructose-1,6-bisphosphatase/inositol monophosphatase family enzyme